MAAPSAEKVFDARVYDVDRKYLCRIGPDDVLFRKVQSTTATPNNLLFNDVTPSIDTGLERRIFTKYQLRFTWNAVPGRTYIRYGDNRTVGLRQFPLHSCASNVKVTLDGSSFEYQSNDTVHSLGKYGTTVDDRIKALSGCPSYPDQTQVYRDSGDGARSQFTEYMSMTPEIPRRANIWGNNLAPLADAAYVYTTNELYEPVMVSPLHWGHGDVQSITGVRNYSVEYTFPSLTRAWSGRSSDVAAAFSGPPDLVEFVTNPELIVTFVKFPLNKPPSQVNFYPLYRIGRAIVRSTTLVIAANATASLTTQNVSLGSIPYDMLLYARRSFNSNVSNIPDTFLSLDSLTITFGTQSGRLSNAAQVNLWQNCVRSGSAQSYVQWRGYQGAVQSIRPGRDFSLPPFLCPGVLGNYQVQAEGIYRNLDPLGDLGPITGVDLYLIPITEGWVRIENQVVLTIEGPLTPDIVSRAPERGVAHEEDNILIIGGSFLDTLKGIGRSVLRGVKHVAPVVSSVARMIPHPLAQGIASGADIAHGLASSFGGMVTIPSSIRRTVARKPRAKKAAGGARKPRKPRAKKASAGRKSAGRKAGGALSGGKRITRSALKKRA